MLCELVPGGMSKEISAGQAEQILAAARPCGAVQQARAELTAELTADLRRLDALLRETKKKLAAAVRAAGTSTVDLAGPYAWHEAGEPGRKARGRAVPEIV